MMPNNELELQALFERVNSLEARILILEARLGSLSDPKGNENSKQLATSKNDFVSMKLLGKSFHQADYNNGDSSDRIDLSFQFNNHLPKDIRAFTGVVIFSDLFDRTILKVGLTEEGGVQAGGTTIWRGGIEYNQFTSEHNRLLSINLDDLQVSFVLQQAIYKDGTKETFEPNA